MKTSFLYALRDKLNLEYNEKFFCIVVSVERVQEGLPLGKEIVTAVGRIASVICSRAYNLGDETPSKLLASLPSFMADLQLSELLSRCPVSSVCCFKRASTSDSSKFCVLIDLSLMSNGPMRSISSLASAKLSSN
eukprot:TRINITY_DN5966_c0_g2_i1.p1 TRINITY_DN5966_c0_g2~~TRINITY_DN5966_c0_g2_i1.p1  ORF type:complete len:135 (+),score=16.62 TRINITY_DN5966_c0_g2_i1:178-582(+)